MYNCNALFNTNFHTLYLQASIIHTDLYVAEGSEPHLSGHAPTGGQQGSTYSLQGRQTDGRQAGAEAEEEAEGGGHDWGVGADQGDIQQGQDVKELVFRLRPVALEDPQHLTLTPNITLLQPETTDTHRLVDQ